MAKRDIVKNAVWGTVDFMALPVVAALSFATGEYGKMQAVSKDLDNRLNSISKDIEQAKQEWKERSNQTAEGLQKDGVTEEQEDVAGDKQNY